MTLTDAGPLVALVDAGEPDYERCREALDALRLPLTTRWPAFTEAIYLLGRAAGWPAQEALWKLVERSILMLADLTKELTARTAELMRRYHDHRWISRMRRSSPGRVPRRKADLLARHPLSLIPTPRPAAICA